jgi:hypothetical protein
LGTGSDLQTLSFLCCLPLLLLLVAAWLVGASPAPSPIRTVAWRLPAAVLLVGPVVALALMFMPVTVRMPGDEDVRVCGNGFGVTMTKSSLSDPTGNSRAYTDCVSTSTTRRTAAIAVLAGTALATTFLAVRARRRRSA